MNARTKATTLARRAANLLHQTRQLRHAATQQFRHPAASSTSSNASADKNCDASPHTKTHHPSLIIHHSSTRHSSLVTRHSSSASATTPPSYASAQV